MKFEITVIAGLLMGVLMLWAFTGGLWERKARTLDFHRIYQAEVQRQRSQKPESPYDATKPGQAEAIRDFLYQGTSIPGWSVAPTVAPTAHQAANQDRIAVQRPTRFATQSKAVADLAGKLGGIPPQDISLVSWSERLWLDSALGCARPGEVMVPARLNGWMFVLRAAQKPRILYIYHATQDGRHLRFCQAKQTTTEL